MRDSTSIKSLDFVSSSKATPRPEKLIKLKHDAKLLIVKVTMKPITLATTTETHDLNSNSTVLPCLLPKALSQRPSPGSQDLWTTAQAKTEVFRLPAAISRGVYPSESYAAPT